MRVGIAADHGGYELKRKLIEALKDAGHEIRDFGAVRFDAEDDYPDLVIPLARAVAAGQVDRAVAVCGSGVGACIAANKVRGVRAALVTDCYSARQGVEDDDMNVLCLGGRVTGPTLALELVLAFLQAGFKGTPRYRRRLAKVAQLEGGEPTGTVTPPQQNGAAMQSNPLLEIRRHGQSIWLDDIRRSMITSGELKQLVDEDGLRGVTSNPKIFDQAIADSRDYDDAIAALAGEDRGVEEIYRAVTVKDVQMAADVFRGVYEGSAGDHGFVSLEVNPHLAYRTRETIAEARELWRALDRPNVFIKVPATVEGLPAIRQLISEGINVNVTLLFGLPRYRAVAEAYLAGLEQRAAAEQPLDKVRSVASFFLSRIDVLIDPQLEEIAKGGNSAASAARRLQGQVAIASAKQAYSIYREMFGSDRFRRLAERGAKPQRVLWASTSTKNPAYSDVKYVEALIGPETVNTLPRETLDAYRDHGRPAPRLEQDLEESRRLLEMLGRVGIDIDRATRQLEREGVEKFNQPFDSLMQTLDQKRRRP